MSRAVYRNLEPDPPNITVQIDSKIGRLNASDDWRWVFASSNRDQQVGW